MGIPVKLEAFEGPLDLLLKLIEKDRIDIYDIPIVTITDQYMEYMEKMPAEDMDTLSEFLVMAATLIRIKSKMLLPAEKEGEEEPADPRAELVERLLEYKMYKYASVELKDRHMEAARAVYREPNVPEEARAYPGNVDVSEILDGVTMKRLLDVFEMLLKKSEDRADPVHGGFGKIEKERISLSDRISDIRKYIKGKKDISFRSLARNGRDTGYLIVSFLAVLELMKTGELYARQDGPFDDIILSCREPEGVV